jgi:hypothetical protein
MLESTEMVRSGLERGLAELEALGLVRPANVLLSEYLSALTAENVLDVATAERVSAAYNRAMYSAAAADSRDVREAVTSLDRIAQRLAALSPQDRQQIAKRIQDRIQSQPAEQLAERETESLAGGWKTGAPPKRSPQSTRRHRDTRSSVEQALCSLESSDANGPLASPVPPATRKRLLSPRVSLALSAVAALVTFFGGYFFRDNVNKLAVVGTDGASFGSEELGARDPWKDLELWLNGIRWRADEAARSQHDDKAKCAAPVGLVRRCSALDRLGYELRITYEPNNGPHESKASVGTGQKSLGRDAPSRHPRYGRRGSVSVRQCPRSDATRQRIAHQNGRIGRRRPRVQQVPGKAAQEIPGR